MDHGLLLLVANPTARSTIEENDIIIAQEKGLSILKEEVYVRTETAGRCFMIFFFLDGMDGL